MKEEDNGEEAEKKQDRYHDSGRDEDVEKYGQERARVGMVGVGRRSMHADTHKTQVRLIIIIIVKIFTTTQNHSENDSRD